MVLLNHLIVEEVLLGIRFILIHITSKYILYLFNDFLLKPFDGYFAHCLVYQSIKYMLHMWNIDKNIRLLSVNMNLILGNPQLK